MNALRIVRVVISAHVSVHVVISALMSDTQIAPPVRRNAGLETDSRGHPQSNT